MKKFILLLSATLLFNTYTFADTLTNQEPNFLSSDEISPRYKGLQTSTNGFDISSKGIATCQGATITLIDYKAKVEVELQKKGTVLWSTTKKWTKTSDTNFATVSEKYTVSKGTYRLKTIHYSLDSNGKEIEAVTKYSSTISY